jgi:hypothetical protein
VTRKALDTAKQEGIPFSIKMADRREYRVNRAEQIHIARTHVVVIDDRTFPHILPLLTITGLSYLKPAPGSGRKGNR